MKAATAQYTYTFAGWDKDVVEVTEDATYTATYTEAVNEYTVTWKDDNGTVLREDTLAYGENPAYGSEPMKAADEQYTYTFAGWDPEVVAVIGDAEYTATYTATEIPAEEAVVDEEVADEDAAKTGDNMNVALLFGVMLFAVLGMIAVVLKKRNA